MSQSEFTLKPFEGQPKREHGGKCMLPPFFADFEERISDAPVLEDDVWMISYPRTGSTWCQEIVWLIGNQLDFRKARDTLQQLRAPLLETSVAVFDFVGKSTDTLLRNELPLPVFKKGSLPFNKESLDVTSEPVFQLFTDSAQYIEKLPPPRFIKSHLPVELLPAKLFTVKPKIIYIMRHPKDLCVSYYYFCKISHQMHVDFNYFCELFMNDALPIGSVFNHYLGFWNKRHEKNILIIRFEELVEDSRKIVKMIAKFMEKTLNEEDIEAICAFLSFQNMRDNKACNLQVLVDARRGDNYYKESGNHFIRKGIVGDYKNIMSTELIEKFDTWINKNIEGTDLTF